MDATYAGCPCQLRGAQIDLRISTDDRGATDVALEIRDELRARGWTL